MLKMLKKYTVEKLKLHVLTKSGCSLHLLTMLSGSFFTLHIFCVLHSTFSLQLYQTFSTWKSTVFHKITALVFQGRGRGKCF